MSDFVIETCDAPGCDSRREWRDHAPRGWYRLALILETDQGSRRLPSKSACSSACASRLTQTMFEAVDGDAAINVCRGGHDDSGVH